GPAQIVDRSPRRVALDIRRARSRIGDCAAQVDPIRGPAGTARTSKGLRRRSDPVLAALIACKKMDAQVAALPNGGCFASILRARSQHLRQAYERSIVHGLDGTDWRDRDPGPARRLDDAAIRAKHPYRL